MSFREPELFRSRWFMFYEDILTRSQNTLLNETVLPISKEHHMDLSNSVIMPRDDFDELVSTAYSNQHVPFKDRAASTAQTTVVLAALVGSVTAGTWGCAKAVDWLETRRLARKFAKPETISSNE